ncbi:hypothetical protein PCAR4_40067 [Paraburkholderia caribensis]|nr:hypothetical protein PCAR4_40067 [Paraburkholderia caribensis]
MLRMSRMVFCEGWPALAEDEGLRGPIRRESPDQADGAGSVCESVSPFAGLRTVTHKTAHSLAAL